MRLGVRTLGELAKLGRGALTDRFGEAGGFAHRLASRRGHPAAPAPLARAPGGGDGRRRARARGPWRACWGCWSSRLLARAERRGRSLRAVTLSAGCSPGGGWRERVVFRQPLADRRAHHAGAVAAPAERCPRRRRRCAWRSRASARRRASRERCSTQAPAAPASSRLREARRPGARASPGSDAALRAVCVDPDSRVPERRVVLTPMPS